LVEAGGYRLVLVGRNRTMLDEAVQSLGGRPTKSWSSHATFETLLRSPKRSIASALAMKSSAS
jgi:hypothetical protein